MYERYHFFWPTLYMAHVNLYPGLILKTNAARITERDIDIFHDDS